MFGEWESFDVCQNLLKLIQIYLKSIKIYQSLQKSIEVYKTKLILNHHQLPSITSSLAILNHEEFPSIQSGYSFECSNLFHGNLTFLALILFVLPKNTAFMVEISVTGTGLIGRCRVEPNYLETLAKGLVFVHP